jgi:nitroimidazol reductase NimA-like FMN-containing flavoprotein (pyridoxamine 5'-phosphate oxidase superfamily)
LVLYRRANRQYVAMSRKEVWQFLGSQLRVYLGFTMEDGYPHVTPIWFVIAGERVYMRAQDYKVKVGLAARGKACVVIDEGDKYRELRGVVMWGRSRIISERRLVGRIAELFEEKYSARQWKADEMPEDWVNERTKEKRAYIEFVPEKVDSWDNAKLQRGEGITSGSRPRRRTLRGRSRDAPD